MKVLIVNSSDTQGGAARAAYRLHRALIDEGINSTMLVQKKSSDDFTVRAPATKTGKFWAQVRPHLDTFPLKFYPHRTQTPFSVSWLGYSNIVKQINDINPDIVHLHWICDGMIKIEEIAKIQAPIVWSLHDMWAFTGGCHYDELCEAYVNTCGSCKVLNSNKKNDLSRKIFRRKQKTFVQKTDITIIGLSRWISQCSQNSTLLKDKRHINIPNPIDTDIFKPFDKEKARELWNLPKNKKLILFGAINATSDSRKGFKELKQALNTLESNQNTELVVFGSSHSINDLKTDVNIRYIGQLHDDISLVALYNAVDVMIVPSLQENLSNAIMESLSCGTPVVAFNIGGNSDMINHKTNGYLAQPFDPNDLAKGIQWILQNKSYDKLSTNARDKVLREFNSNIVVKQYIALYEEILA